MNAAWPDPAALPPLAAYVRPLDQTAVGGHDGQLYWRERAAARDAAAVEQLRLIELEYALAAARQDFLARDWRERGLAKAVEEVTAGRPGWNLWVWLEINKLGRDLWEPGAVAAAIEAGMPVSWKSALLRWRCVLWQVKAAQELDAGSVSRWAGFNLVWAYVSCGGWSQRWEAVLNRHEGMWPETLLGCQGRWSDTVSAHRLLQELDGIDLLFDIGLADGGEPIDWRGRHVQRISRWRMAGERERALAQLDRISPDDRLHRIPPSWLSPD